MPSSPFDRAAVFPFPSEADRLNRYKVNDLMLEGNHFAAFGIKAGADFSKRYEKIRYVVANFNGLVARSSADILMGETLNFKAENNQEWLDDLWMNNRMQTQLFESAVSNSALGDAVFRIRTENEELIIEDVSPYTYFPIVDRVNPRRAPKAEELVHMTIYGGDRYLVREIHWYGYIETKVYRLKTKGNEVLSEEEQIEKEIPVDLYNMITGERLVPYVETGIDWSTLIFHVPNWRMRGSRKYWGDSDFVDLHTLQFALNNRLSKVDNVLDKHSDPILAVPPGVLDEHGRVKKEAFNMIELTEEGEGKPEYIVWNANLDSAFKEIDKLVEFLFLSSEVSPDMFGLGKSGGQAESGRALKFRLLKTLAKKNRKRLYYDQAVSEIMAVAQELSVTQGYKVNGNRISEVDKVQLVWPDGVIDDPVEQAEVSTALTESGLQSKKSAIMDRGLSEKEAEAEIERIKEDQADFAGDFEGAEAPAK